MAAHPRHLRLRKTERRAVPPWQPGHWRQALALDYAQTGDVGRAFTELETTACTSHCQEWQSHAVVYRIRTANLNAHLVGWVLGRMPEEAWRAWAERTTVDLTR